MILEGILISLAASLIHDLGKKTLFELTKDNRSEYEQELALIIDNTIKDFKKRGRIRENKGKFPFYDSKDFLDIFLKFGFNQDINISLLEENINKIPNIIPPKKEELESFLKIFSNKINHSDKFNHIQIKIFLDSKFLEVINKLEELNSNLHEIISSLDNSLKQEFKAEIIEIEKCLYSFKPKTALSLIINLEQRIKESNSIDNLISSKILFIQAQCKKDLQESKSEVSQLFIRAYKLNPNDEILKKTASAEYINIGESEKSLKIVDEILKIDEYNISCWIIKTTISKNFEEFLKTVPKIVKNNKEFQKAIIFNLTNNQRIKDYSSLDKYGLFIDIDEDKQQKLTYQNKKYFEINIDLLINTVLTENEIFYIKGKDFKIEEYETLDLLIRFLTIYVNTLTDTELKNVISHQKFYLNYFKYLTTNEIKYFENIKNIYPKIKFQLWSYTFHYCQMLNHNEKYSEALKVLEEFQKKSTEINKELLIFKTVLYDELGKIDEISNVFREFLNSIKSIDEKNLINIINLFGSCLYKKVDEKNLILELEYLLRKKFKYEYLKEFTKIVIDNSFLKRINPDELLNRFIILSKVKKIENSFLKGLIAENIIDLGNTQYALDFLNTYIDKNTINESLRLYILTLYERLREKEQHKAGMSKELLELLMFWRKNSSTPDVHLLDIEYNLYREIQDWKKALPICKLLFKHFPHNEAVIQNYINALEKLNKFKKLKKISNEIPVHYKNEQVGLFISSVLQRTDTNKKKAFEILYSLAQNPVNSLARMNYFSASNLYGDYLIKYNTVELNSFVKYEVNEKQFEKKIEKDDDIFFGKKNGETFKSFQKLTNSYNEIKIIGIYNNYLKLFYDITEEAHNPLNDLGIQSFSFNSNDPKKMIEDLVSKFGVQGTLEKDHKKISQKDYKSYKIGFTEITNIVFKRNYILSYDYLTSSPNKFTNIPSFLLSNTKTKDSVFILDFSSLMLFYKLDKDLGFKFNTKFVVSSLIESLIKKLILTEKVSPLSTLSMDISLDGITPYSYPSDRKEKLIDYYNEILIWIKNNCKLEVVEEKLDITLKFEEKVKAEILDIIIDSHYLSLRPKHLLISSDIIYLKFNYNCLFSLENYLLSYFPQKSKTELQNYLLSKRYLGIDISYNTLVSEFLKMISGKNNNYSLCLENLQYDIYLNQEKLEEIAEFIKYIYLLNVITLEHKNRHSSNLLNFVFIGTSKDIRTILYSIIESKFKLLGQNYDEVLKTFQICENDIQ